MYEPTNESQPTTINTTTNTSQTTPALAGVCLVCGGGCAVGDTMCARCDGLMRGWLREYPAWLDSLHEFLDSTAHYGGRQPGRVNLPAAPTPIRLPVLDHMQAIEDAAIALWRRLYAPPAMPWATYGVHPPLVDMLRVCAGSPRLRRMPDIADFYHEWESMVRKTLDIIDVPPSKHGIGRCPNPLCGVELSAPIDAVEVTCPVCGGTYRVVDVRQSVHGRGMRRTPARMRVPMRREHDLLVAQSWQDPTSRQEREGTAALPSRRRAQAAFPTRLDLTFLEVQGIIVSGLEGSNRRHAV